MADLRADRDALLSQADPSPLVAAYLARRQDLLRFFILRLGSAAAAEDLVQDVYLRISAGGIGPVDNPMAYLYRLGSNLMLDRLKQQRRSVARDDAWQLSRHTFAGEEAIADIAPADEAVAARERLRQLMAALDELPPQCRKAFRLHKLDGLSHAETAAAMGISRSAVEKHISAALKFLLARLG